MNLDEMLSQPLPDLPDNGFSARVIAGVKREERRKAGMVVLLSVVAAALTCLLLPVHEILGDLAAAVVLVGATPMLGLAVAVLVLTFLIDRILTDRQFLRI